MVGNPYKATQALGPKPRQKFGIPKCPINRISDTEKSANKTVKNRNVENPKKNLQEILPKKLAKIQKSQREYSDYLLYFLYKNGFIWLWIYLYGKSRL